MGGPYGVFDENGTFIIAPEYKWITPSDGGVYIVEREDGSEALFDWKGNQRTQFFDEIYTYSENGQYFIVRVDGKMYAMKTPLSDEELSSFPLYDPIMA